ncbi:MAG: hypothetical protein GY707_04600 [Desulfobacteraceae bacterium]|nr:hypothetical protein [Desulfobacteraceae bacterium]
MAHEHSVTIHDYLSLKIEDVKKKKDKAKSLGNDENIPFYNGQLDELLNIRKYLTDQIDLDTQKYYN